MEVAKNIALIATNTFLLLLVLFLRACMSLSSFCLVLTRSFFLCYPSSHETSVAFFIVFMPIVFNLILLFLIKDYVLFSLPPHL